MPLIRSISGLRATVSDDSLTPGVVVDYCLAFHAILPPGTIVLGRDGRPSGSWIQDVALQAFNAVGRNVRVVGMVPTPTVQLLTEHSDAIGGISITASHNPADWNGMKFVAADGTFLDADGNVRLWEQLGRGTRDGDDARPEADHESDQDNASAIDEHIARVVALDTVAAAPPAATGEKVVVDAVNASGSVIVPALLRRLGYTVVELYCNGNGQFPHTPEPLAEHLGDLCRAVVDHGAAFGVAVDPDGDRLVLVDHTGTPIGEEYTIALATDAVYTGGRRGPVVVNYSTTRVVDDVAARYGCDVVRAPVGEINVVRAMQASGAVIGGEGSGGVIDPACHYGRDSLVGIGLITALLRRTGRTLAQAVADLPRYAMIKTRLDLADRAQAQPLLEAVVTALGDGATVSLDDGVHVAWSDRWVHVRASNTEPILRIIAEAPDRAAAETLIDRIHDLRPS